MSEFTTSKEFQEFKDSVASFHATTRESFLKLEFNVNKIMTNELVHVQADLNEFKNSFKELNKSIIPFIQKVNDALASFEKRDNDVEKKLEIFNTFMEDQKKNLYKVVGGVGVILFVLTFFANEIKGLFR